MTAAIARVQSMLNQAAAKPLASQIPGQPGDSALLLNGVAAALYSKSFWPYLRLGLTAAFEGNGTVLVALGDVLVERNRSGHYSNLTAAELAVDCIDRPWPRNLPAWQTAAASAARAAPMFGEAIMWGSLPCAYWPVPPAAPVRLRGAGAPPILVVGNTAGPGHAVPLGPGARGRSQVRGAARLERRRAHRLHDGQLVHRLGGGQVPDQPGAPAQRDPVPVTSRQAAAACPGQGRAGTPGR